MLNIIFFLFRVKLLFLLMRQKKLHSMVNSCHITFLCSFTIIHRISNRYTIIGVNILLYLNIFQKLPRRKDFISLQLFPWNHILQVCILVDFFFNYRSRSISIYFNKIYLFWKVICIFICSIIIIVKENIYKSDYSALQRLHIVLFGASDKVINFLNLCFK